MTDTAVESTAVDEPQAAPAGELVKSSTPSPIRAAAIGDTQAAMGEYQEGVRALLDTTDYQDAGGGRQFVKKSGWRKIAMWYGLSVERIEETIERDPAGEPLRAKSIYRATAPNGRFMDGDGYCAVTEFSGRREGSVKLENDMRATATTRAKNRAIADLVGMGDVSAEEVTTGGEHSGMPDLLKVVEGGDRKTAIKALVFLLSRGTGQATPELADQAAEVWAELGSVQDRKNPSRVVADALVRVGKKLKGMELDEQPADAKPEGEAGAEPVEGEVVDDGEPAEPQPGDEQIGFD